MRYRWILFDADGTLFDFDTAEATALAATWNELGLPSRATLHAEFRAINRDLWPQYEQGSITQAHLRLERFRRLLAGIAREPEAVSELYLRRLAESAQLIDGARELLDELRGRVGMVLVTNGVAAVQHGRLDRSGLRGHFEAVVISDEIGHAKPHARFFDVAFDRIGNPARAEVLMVGDNLAVDIRGAADYGLDTCWVNPHGAARPGDPPIQHEVRTVAELRPLLLDDRA